MNFEDTLKIGAKVYDVGYAEIGGRYYSLNENGSIDTTDCDNDLQGGYDDNGNPLIPIDTVFIDFGKCTILPNSRASIIGLADGQQYIYTYEVYAPLSKAKYPLIPKEGDKVVITKKDGTIDKEMEVKGFVTYKQRYLKLWL